MKSKIYLAMICLSFFLIVAGSQSYAASITVQSPNGNERWIIGHTYDIKWTSSDVAGKVVIVLRKGGKNYKNITDTSGTTNDGKFEWHIPNDISPGSDYKIRIKSETDGSVRDTSNSKFTITNTLTSNIQTTEKPKPVIEAEKGGLTRLCWVVDCAAMASRPRITSTSEWIGPGYSALVNGFNFGDTPGQAWLVGDFQGGTIPLILDPEWWSDTQIYVKIPYDTVGVKMQFATLRVKNNASTQVAEFTIIFKPRLDFTYLPKSALVNTACSGFGGNYDRCYEEDSSMSFEGIHHNPNTFSSITGDDTYTAKLENGWYFDGFIYNFEIKSLWDSWVNTHGSSFPEGSTDLYLQVNFGVEAEFLPMSQSWVRYRGRIGIIGPIGVPIQ